MAQQENHCYCTYINIPLNKYIGVGLGRRIHWNVFMVCVPWLALDQQLEFCETEVSKHPREKNLENFCYILCKSWTKEKKKCHWKPVWRNFGKSLMFVEEIVNRVTRWVCERIVQIVALPIFLSKLPKLFSGLCRKTFFVVLSRHFLEVSPRPAEIGAGREIESRRCIGW
jgi:hypothetical protein